MLPVAGVLPSTAVVLPGLPRGPWMLAGALLVFGFCNGLLGVSMNAHAVHVEKAYNRPVMSAFHAMFSVGGHGRRGIRGRCPSVPVPVSKSLL
jgi:hypothetical protein